MWQRLRVIAFPLAFAAPLAAQTVSEVQVAPPTITIRVGERSGLLATAFDRIGNVIPTARFAWSSSNANVARVDANGTVTGVGGGVVTIEARVGGQRGQATVQVIGPPAGGGHAPPPPAVGQSTDPLAGQPPGSGVAAALRIEPPTVFLLPSENTRVTPRALRADGGPAAPVRVTWRSLREDVASVDQNGNVIGLSTGQAVLQASGPNGLTATAPVVVQPAQIAIGGPAVRSLSPGQSDTLAVVVPSQGGRFLNALQLQWASGDPGVVRVGLGGVITGVAMGRTTVTVRGLLQEQSVDVVVHRPVELLVVRPRSSGEVVVPLGGSQKFQATALAGDNTPIPEARLRWRVADTTLAIIDQATGVLTGRGVGHTQLTVWGPGPGLSATWNVTVAGGALRLTEPRVGVALNKRRALSASYVDAQGVPLTGAVGVTWTSERPDVADVATDGTVTGRGYGRTHVFATGPGGGADTGLVFVQGELLVASSRTGRFQLYSVERANLAQLRRVTADSGAAYDPAYSPDGSRIAFASQREGTSNVYVMDADGANVVQLTRGRGPDGHPAFTADGRTIVFQSSRTPSRQIWSVGIDGSNLRQLTQEPASNAQPSVSPDGSTIAFSSTKDGNYDIWLMAVDGSQQRAFTRSQQWKETYPRFLRDGTLAYLVERLERGRTVTQVYRADLTTGESKPITGTDLQITAFAMSPAGDLLALVVPVPGGGRDGAPLYRVYVQPVGAGGPVPIPAAANEQIISPAFQP